MGWVDHIVIMATTRMMRNICVAGQSTSGSWVRPIKIPGFSLNFADLKGPDGFVVVENYNQVEFSFVKKFVGDPHSEDVLVDWSVQPRLLRRLSDDEVFELLQRTDETREVGTNIEGYLISHKRSLVNVRPDGPFSYEMKQQDCKTQRIITFAVNGREYPWPCTDLRWRALTRQGDDRASECLDEAEDLRLTIGLGRPWGRPPYAPKPWPFVLAIHTYPTYQVVIDYDKL